MKKKNFQEMKKLKSGKIKKTKTAYGKISGTARKNKLSRQKWDSWDNGTASRGNTVPRWRPVLSRLKKNKNCTTVFLNTKKKKK